MTSRTEKVEIALLIGIGILIYLGSLNVPFVFDDLHAILPNQQITSLWSSLTHLFSLRGVSYLSFAVNYALSGFEVWSWHLVNLAVHLGSTVMVYLLLRKFFDQSRPLPLLGALFFLTHPIQTQAVTYIVQRMASLATLLLLLSVFCFIQGREIFVRQGTFFAKRQLSWYLGSLFFGVLAPLAKENTAVLPLLLLLTAWFLSAGRFAWKRELAYLAPFWVGVLLVALYIAFHGNFVGRMVAEVELFTSADPAQTEVASNIPAVRWKYLATQCAAVWIYLKLLVAPWGQRLEYSYPLAQTFFEVRVLAGLAGLAGLALGTVLSRNRYLIFAFLWFLTGLLVESSVLPLDPVFEHRMYLPMFGVAVAFCELWRRAIPEGAEKGAAFALIGGLCLLTVARNQVWRDPVRLWTDNLDKVPYSYRVKLALSEALLKADREAEAVRLVEEVMREKPSRAMVASDVYRENLIELGKAQIRFGRTATAVETLRRAVDYYPLDAQAHLYLGAAYVELGDRVKARLHLACAGKLDPDNPVIREQQLNLSE